MKKYLFSALLISGSILAQATSIQINPGNSIVIQAGDTAVVSCSGAAVAPVADDRPACAIKAVDPQWNSGYNYYITPGDAYAHTFDEALATATRIRGAGLCK